MKILITALLSLSFSCLSAQTIEKFYNYNWNECEPIEARFYAAISKTDSGYVRKDYFIHEKTLQMSGKYLDPETKIADGYFYYFHPNGSLDGVGKYENGRKEGLWLHYYPDKMIMDSGFYAKGNLRGTSLSWHINGFLKDSTVINENGKGVMVSWFDNGNPSSAGFITNGSKPDGTWKYFHKNGQLSAKEAYKNDVLMSKSYYDENGDPVADTTNRDRGAEFPGGSKAWQKYLVKQIYFPDQYKIANADKAVVVVSFTINEEGKVEEVDVTTPFYPQFDKIAKNAIVKSPDWLPSIRHNRKVKYRIHQPITFTQ